MSHTKSKTDSFIRLALTLHAKKNGAIPCSHPNCPSHRLPFPRESMIGGMHTHVRHAIILAGADAINNKYKSAAQLN